MPRRTVGGRSAIQTATRCCQHVLSRNLEVHISQGTCDPTVCYTNSNRLRRHCDQTCVQDSLPEQCAEVVCAYKMRRLREAFRMLKIPVAEYTEGSPQHDDPFGCVKPKDYLAIYRHTSIARRTQPWRSPQTTSFCIGVPVQGTPKRSKESLRRLSIGWRVTVPWTS